MSSEKYKLNLPLFNKYKEMIEKENILNKLQDELSDIEIKKNSIPTQKNIG